MDESAAARLHARLRAMAEGDPNAVRLAETVWEVLARHVYVSAYVRAHRDSPEWPQLAADLLAEEDWWPPSTDPDVLAFFEEAVRLEEERRRAECKTCS